MNTNDFGNRLKEVMNLRGIKQIELAEKTGISRGALSSYISGRWEAKSNNLYKLAYALNVSPAWLLGLDSTMKQNTSNNRIIGARIIEARKAKNITAKELADKIHVAASTISRYEKGEINKIKMPIIDAIARALDVNPMWILGKSKYPDKNDMIKSWNIPLPDGAFRPALKRVPMLGYAAAGEPLENLDGQDTYYVETDSKYHVDFCITVRGDSMINAGINDGDIVFVRRQPEVENGQVACVEIERSKVCIKRFYKTDNGVMLVSENPKYAPLQFNETNCDDFRILGLAVIKQSEIH